MDKKISTSVQYQFTNVILFHEIFENWDFFNAQLKKGPEVMKKFLLYKWNETRDELRKNENLIVKDIDKEVKENDFDITINKTDKGVTVFFFTFPDYEYKDAASKYLALVLDPKAPRYITLEYSEHVMLQTPCFVIGEFYIDGNMIKHLNYGTIENSRLSYFSGYVLGMLNSGR